MSQALAAALARLLEAEGDVGASVFTTAQRRAMDELARKTGALRVKSEGRGSVYQVVHPELLANHLRALRPRRAEELDPDLPIRAANIGKTRSSKGGVHGHALHYLLVKAISAGVSWEIGQDGSARVFDLSAATEVAGAGVLALAEEDDWRSGQALWLVENQALFDRLDWMPPASTGTVGYYAGQLPARLLEWIAARQRAPEIILFSDYDGVGLLNFARLREVSPGPSSFWLMPNWRARLAAFGNKEVWRNTQSEFQTALAKLEAMGMDAALADLCIALSREGLALEHESIWL